MSDVSKDGLSESLGDRPIAQFPPVRKAVIPAAGYGTRLFPATKAIKKEFFPLIDRQGRAKPVIQIIVEEALNAGLESVAIVVQAGDRPLFEDFFRGEPSGPYRQKLFPKYADEWEALRALGDRVTLLTQDSPEGFGHAVYCAQDWVGEEPFLLLLGDHVYRSTQLESCASQLLAVYRQFGKSVIGVESALVTEIEHRGCVTGLWKPVSKLPILDVTQIYEKPTVDYARQHLHIAGMPEDYVLSIFGLYLLSADIFRYLAADVQQNRRDRGEFQLTPCLDRLQQDAGMLGYLVRGQSFDIGQPEHYRRAILGYSLAETTA